MSFRIFSINLLSASPPCSGLNFFSLLRRILQWVLLIDEKEDQSEYLSSPYSPPSLCISLSSKSFPCILFLTFPQSSFLPISYFASARVGFRRKKRDSNSSGRRREASPLQRVVMRFRMMDMSICFSISSWQSRYICIMGKEGQQPKKRQRRKARQARQTRKLKEAESTGRRRWGWGAWSKRVPARLTSKASSEQELRMKKRARKRPTSPPTQERKLSSFSKERVQVTLFLLFSKWTTTQVSFSTGMERYWKSSDIQLPVSATMLENGSRLTSVSISKSSISAVAFTPAVVVKGKIFLSSTKVEMQSVLSEGLIMLPMLPTAALKQPFLARQSAIFESGAQLGQMVELHFLMQIEKRRKASEVMEPATANWQPRGGHSQYLTLNFEYWLIVSELKLKCSRVQRPKATREATPTVPSFEYELSSSYTLKLVLLLSITPIPATVTANMKLPEGLAMIVESGGSGVCWVSAETLTVLLARTLSAALTKRMKKRTMMRREQKPPVAVLYSGSPLYLRNC